MRTPAAGGTPVILPGLEPLAHPIADLIPYPGNAKRHDIPLLMRLLQARGQWRAAVAQTSTRHVLVGNGMVEAARQLGWDRIAVVWMDCDDDEARETVLADNRSHDVGGYDEAAELRLLIAASESERGLELTGYAEADLQALLDAAEADMEGSGGTGSGEPVDDGEVAAPPDEPVTRPGDVWILGPHRLVCGDSADGRAIEALMGPSRGSCAAMWTDPPYGVSYSGGPYNPRAAIAGDTGDHLPALLDGAFANASATALRPGARFYVASPPGETSAVFVAALRGAGWKVRSGLVWVKSHFVLGWADYHMRHEVIWYGSVPGDDGHATGRSRAGNGADGQWWGGTDGEDSVFEFPQPDRSPDHPTMKPAALVTKQLGHVCRAGDLVYDPFAGSGSVMLACHALGLEARMCELEPSYADVICRRWQDLTGELPVREGTGEQVDVAAGSR